MENVRGESLRAAGRTPSRTWPSAAICRYLESYSENLVQALAGELHIAHCLTRGCTMTRIELGTRHLGHCCCGDGQAQVYEVVVSLAGLSCPSAKKPLLDNADPTGVCVPPFSQVSSLPSPSSTELMGYEEVVASPQLFMSDASSSSHFTCAPESFFLWAAVLQQKSAAT